jgi:carboxylesterase
VTSEILPGSDPFSSSGDGRGELVLHAYTDNPQTMRSIAEMLAALGYTVEMPRLPGHGTTVEDLKRCRWSDFVAEVERACDTLTATCDRVAIVGLSMGGGLTCHLAENRDVAGIALINPFLKAPPAELRDGVKAGIDAGVDELPGAGADIKKPGVDGFSYAAMPAIPLLSFAEGIDVVEAHLCDIMAPMLLLTSREDHVVFWENGGAVVERSAGPVERIWLEDSCHVATIDNDQPLIESAIAEFFGRVFLS